MAFAVGSLPPSSRRDRTSEFHAIADRLRKTQASHGSGANGSATASNGHHHHESSRLLGPEPSGSAQSEFNRRASRIGLSIHQTSQKLSKLTKLAKRTSMFDDPAVEIQDLTSVIKQDITALNAAISDLQVLCDSRNEAANRTKHSSEHSTTIVDDLKSRLMSTTKDFKDVLTMRTEVSLHPKGNL
jgi:syntaxin 5